MVALAIGMNERMNCAQPQQYGLARVGNPTGLRSDPSSRPGRCAAALRLAVLVLLACFFPFAQASPETARQEVFAAERAFARSMGDRNLSAFGGFIADEAIFFSGQGPLRGKPQIVASWSRYFEAPIAPFSWEPDQVEVLESGSLALSTGLVRDSRGQVIGRFNSIWRLESPGTWRVVFDKGSPPSAADKGAAP